MCVNRGFRGVLHNVQLLLKVPHLERIMANTALLVDLERAYDLLSQVDENKLDFTPDGNVSADIGQLTGLQAYPVESHRANMKARIDAVVKAGDQLEQRDASEYVSKLIMACMKLGPPTDDRCM